MYNYSDNMYNNPEIKSVFNDTRILRKPISGIVSGYHELKYILVSPDEESSSRSLEISGKIKVSPRFILDPSSLGNNFDEVFDPGSFDNNIQGRLFSFAYSRKKNIKIESEYLNINNIDDTAEAHIEKVHEDLMRQENTRSGLVFCPSFKFYPVSIDKFLGEITDREFR